MRLALLRIAAVLFALTWLVFPGFGLADLSVSWDPDWPVVLEAGWGAFVTVLVGGAFLAVAVRPRRAAPALATLGVSLAALLVAAAAGLEWQVLGFAAFLAVQTAVLLLLLGRGSLPRPAWQPSWPLAVVALTGVVPWAAHAESLFRSSRGGAGEAIGELTMGVDHFAVQGALALAVAALALLAAAWPDARRSVGVGAGLAAGYVGLVSFAFPGTWAGLGPAWSVVCLVWSVAVVALAVLGPRPRPSDVGAQAVPAP